MATDAQIGQDFTVGAFFENTAGPITGKAANFTVTVTNRSTGAAVTSGAPTENPAGSGYYEFTTNSTYHTAAARFKVVYANTTDELYAEAFYAVGDVSSRARTRRELRRRVATRLLGDEKVWQERASSSASNSATVAYLPQLTVAGEDEYRGAWLRFGSGANRGQERRATAWAAATSLLTWAPALGTAIATDDRVEVYAGALRPSRIDGAIDDAIADLAGHALVEADEAVLETDGTTTEWALPTDAAYVYKVGIVRESDSRFLHWLPNDAWSLVPGGKLRVGEGGYERGPDPLEQAAGYPAALPGDYRLRTLLLCDVEPPLYDDSLVDLPVDAVVEGAVYRLALGMGERAREWPFLERQWQTARAKARTALPGGVRAVLR